MPLVFSKLTQSKSVSVTASQLDEAVEQLEKLLRNKPNDMHALKKLVMILDFHLPSKRGLGAYSDCQHMFSTKFQEKSWIDDVLNSGNLSEHYKQWQAFLDSILVIPKLPVPQLFSGGLITIDGINAYCGLRLSMFKKEGVISRFCDDCFKVQILPVDLAALMQTYFVLRGLKLPRDNTRKCMLEFREDIPYPYKGYIYCESEDEAKFCLEKLQQALRDSRISNVYCGISHGCSEYGLKYPQFKYSKDGAHRSFERPAFWDRSESEFWSVTDKPAPARKDHNKESISIQEMVGFRTWIDYAEIIGDDSSRKFRNTPSANKPVQFAERARKQSQLRKSQMEELRQRLSSTV